MVGVFTGMQHAQAQQYPVQGFLSIIPPYPAQLADYSNPNINRLNLTLTLNDISVNNKRVRLKVFVLRQNSLFTQTSGNYFGDVPITLTSGIPEQLTSSELAGYFKFQNLQGIVPDSYAPERGFYEYLFCGVRLLYWPAAKQQNRVSVFYTAQRPALAQFTPQWYPYQQCGSC